MLTKTAIVLSALIVAGFAQAAMASEALNARIGDRYPFLEQQYPIVEQVVGAYAYASVQPIVQGSVAGERQQVERTGVNANSY